MYHVMVIDKDAGFSDSIKTIIEYDSNFSVDTFLNPLDALEVFNEISYSCVLLNVNLEMMSGMALMKSLQQCDPEVPLILIIDGRSMSVALEGLKQGAFDFIEKDADSNRIFIILKHAIDRRAWYEEKKNLMRIICEHSEITFKSRIMQEVMHRMRHVAQTSTNVLIRGESGTGKKMIAESLHNQSYRQGKRFSVLNCAALPAADIENELFGDGSQNDKNPCRLNGLVYKSQEGTLLLDEISALDRNIQKKLFNLLATQQMRIPERRHRKRIDVRLIGATNKNLEKLVEKGKFREDFYHFINGIHLDIPPLRQRKEDIYPLALHFLERYSYSFNKRLQCIDSAARKILTGYRWPGNVRELKSVIEMIAYFSEHPTITSIDVRKALDIQEQLNEPPVPHNSLKEERQNQEKKHILSVLESNNWRILKTASVLGINRTSLYKKMKMYNIQKQAFN